MVKALSSFINLSEWRERRITCKQLIGYIKHTWKNIVFFHVCGYGFPQGWKFLYNIVVYVINRGYYMAAHSHSWEILSALEDKIRIPKRPRDVLFIL